MLLSYNADLLPHVRMLGRINYTEPWIHFSRTINEYVLYVIRDGNMYLREDGALYHLKAGDFFLLEPDCATRVTSARPVTTIMRILPTRKWRGRKTRAQPWRSLRKSAG